MYYFFFGNKEKKQEEDPDQKWISTWNHYFHRIRHFLNGILIVVLNSKKKIHRKLQIEQQFYENENQENWESPDSLNLKEKKTKS